MDKEKDLDPLEREKLQLEIDVLRLTKREFETKERRRSVEGEKKRYTYDDAIYDAAVRVGWRVYGVVGSEEGWYVCPDLSSYSINDFEQDDMKKTIITIAQGLFSDRG